MDHILVVSAHPDDMEIGMGGTIAKLTDSGVTVTSVILTDGRRSPNPFSWTQDQIVEFRKTEAKNAGSILNIQEILFCNLPDLKSESNYSAATQKLKELIREQHPSQIYTLHPALDQHPTHRIAAKATLDGLKQAKLLNQTELWAYEVWGLFHSWDRLEDISHQIGTKRLAIEEHKSQIAAFPFADGVIGLNRWRAIFANPAATNANHAFVEAFVNLNTDSE